MGKEEKLSFSFSSKPSSKHSSSSGSKRPNVQEASAADGGETKPQFFTVFDPSHAQPAPTRHVIPPIPNTNDFRAGSIKKMKNLLPSFSSSPPHHSSETKFVLDANANTQDPSSLSYGLTLRSDPAAPDPKQLDREQQEEEKDLTLRRFREDMKNLPEDRGMDEFADVPIESFGAAVLAGYGWSEGRGIGRNTKADTKVVQYDRRAGTEGLGYDPLKNPKKKKLDKKAAADRRDPAREEKRKPPENGHPSKTPVRWLRSHIRVRVIDKDFKKGRLYLKKGEVVDVVGPTTCDVSMDGSGELVQGVEQEALETALPKRGGSVLVLYGKHKGVYGSLMERNMEEETGVVRDADSHALINVRLEQIAEYVGDPSYLGY